MSRNSKYDELLLQESKRGRNNSYINLSIIYLQKIFAIVFELVPIKQEAIKLSSEIFGEVWANLDKINDLSEFIKKLERVTAEKCVDFLAKNNIKLLDDEAIDKLSEEMNSPILTIEREILKLTSFERVIIVLCNQVGLSVQTVNDIFGGNEIYGVFDTLNGIRERLVRKIPSENFPQFTENQWIQIHSYFKMVQNSIDINIDESTRNLISNFEAYSSEIMQDLLRHLVPDQKIIENLSNYIFEEDSKKMKGDKKNLDNKSSKKVEVKTKKVTKVKSDNSGILLKTVIVLAIIVISATGYWYVSNIPSVWNISGEISIVTLNGNKASKTDLAEKDCITTSDVRKTKIKLDEFAAIEILENSELIIGKTTSSESDIELKSGKINFNSLREWDEKYKQTGIEYKLKFKNRILSTQKSKFSLNLKEYGDFDINVETGWLSIKLSNNRFVYLANNYNLNFNNRSSIILPYQKEASNELISAVEQFSIMPTDDNLLATILNSATENDVLTLWHLLSVTDSYKTKLVIEKLDKLLLMDLTAEFSKSSKISEKSKNDLLKFIISDLLMRNDEQ